MVVKRFLTGLMALVVAAFSISVMGIMWRVCASRPRFENVTCTRDMVLWKGQAFAAEISANDGVFDRFMLYRR